MQTYLPGRASVLKGIQVSVANSAKGGGFNFPSPPPLIHFLPQYAQGLRRKQNPKKQRPKVTAIVMPCRNTDKNMDHRGYWRAGNHITQRVYFVQYLGCACYFAAKYIMSPKLQSQDNALLPINKAPAGLRCLPKEQIFWVPLIISPVLLSFFTFSERREYPLVLYSNFLLLILTASLTLGKEL